MVFGPMPYGMAMTLFRTNESSDQCNGFSDQWQWAVGPMVFRTNGSSDQWQWQWAVGPSTWHHYVYNACRSPKGMSNRRDAIGSRQDTSIIGHHTCTGHNLKPCLHGVYIVHTLPVRVLREVVKMSSAFPRPTISAANGCAIIAAFPLKRLHHRMRPVDADLVYTSTGQVALTILL